MTWADDQLLTRIVVHLAACMRAERVVCDEVSAVEVDQDAGIARRRNGKICCAIARDGFDLRDRPLYWFCRSRVRRWRGCSIARAGCWCARALRGRAGHGCLVRAGILIGEDKRANDIEQGTQAENAHTACQRATQETAPFLSFYLRRNLPSLLLSHLLLLLSSRLWSPDDGQRLGNIIEILVPRAFRRCAENEMQCSRQASLPLGREAWQEV